MKVAVDASVLTWGTGGIPRYLRQILERLVHHPGNEWQLYTNSIQPTTGLASENAKRMKGAPIWRNTVVARELRRWRPDVYWTPWMPAPLLVPTPYVVSVHDLAPLLFPKSKAWTTTLAFRTTFRHSARKATRVITNSETTRADALDLFGLDPARVRVVPLGVDPWFRPGDREGAQRLVADRFGIQPPFALAAGTLEPRKGLEVLAELVELAPLDSPVFVFAGRPGWGSAALARRLQASPRCHVLGPVADAELVALYQAAECLAIPSLYEGFGLTALESLACGTPVVIPAGAGSLSELFGDVGITVDRRLPGAWQAGLLAAMEDRERLGQIGVQHAARFTWDSAAAKTMAVLGEAANCP